MSAVERDMEAEASACSILNGGDDASKPMPPDRLLPGSVGASEAAPQAHVGLSLGHGGPSQGPHSSGEAGGSCVQVAQSAGWLMRGRWRLLEMGSTDPGG